MDGTNVQRAGVAAANAAAEERFGDAVAEATRALARDPDDVDLLNLRGASNAALERWSAAAGDLRRSVVLKPRQPGVVRLLVGCLLECGALDEAAGHVERLVRRGVGGSRAGVKQAIALARAFQEAGRPGEAVPLLRRLCDRFPRRVALRRIFAECLSRSERYEEAVPHWERVVGDVHAAALADPGAIGELVEALLGADRPADALRVCLSAASAKGFDEEGRAELLVLQSRAQRMLGDLPAARTTMAGIDIDSAASALLCADIADEEEALGRRGRALRAAARGVALEPLSEVALSTLALLLDERGDLRGATAAMLRCARAGPSTAAWWALLGALYREGGRLGRAAVCYRRAIRRGDASHGTRAAATEVLLELGRADGRWLGSRASGVARGAC